MASKRNSYGVPKLPCLLGSPRGKVGIGEVFTGAEGAGVVGAQDVGAVFEGLLVQGDGVVESAGGLVGVGEVVA